MKDKAGPIAVSLAAAVVAGILLFFWLHDEPEETQLRRPESAAAGQETTVVHLYFADASGERLSAEERVLLAPADAAAFARMIVEALIEGPQGGLLRTIPEGTRLRALYLMEDGPAVVDLSADIVDQHPGGAGSELLTIFSLVNSLILNVEDVKTVRLLVSGEEVETLAGHIDIQKPFKADMLLIR